MEYWEDNSHLIAAQYSKVISLPKDFHFNSSYRHTCQTVSTTRDQTACCGWDRSSQKLGLYGIKFPYTGMS